MLKVFVGKKKKAQLFSLFYIINIYKIVHFFYMHLLYKIYLKSPLFDIIYFNESGDINAIKTENTLNNERII